MSGLSGGCMRRVQWGVHVRVQWGVHVRHKTLSMLGVIADVYGSYGIKGDPALGRLSCLLACRLVRGGVPVLPSRKHWEVRISVLMGQFGMSG
jgi:hypothetical protein